jgi:hypothetical protein
MTMLGENVMNFDEKMENLNIFWAIVRIAPRYIPASYYFLT